jgi:hypothetical protein
MHPIMRNRIETWKRVSGTVNEIAYTNTGNRRVTRKGEAVVSDGAIFDVARQEHAVSTNAIKEI